MTAREDLLSKLLRAWNPQADKPGESPESTFKALAEFAGPDQNHLRDLVDRRLSGVPLSYLTGRQTFMNVEMIAGPEALIAREETEILGRGALHLLHSMVYERGSATVIDVCCGSGNIALALATYEPGCAVQGSDISAEAVNLARRNAKFLALENRCSFRQGDLFAAMEAPADLITCNPPYVSTANVEAMPFEISKFEPKLAFDGGPFGVSVLRRLIREAPRSLNAASWLTFEVGSGQGKGMVNMIARSPDYSAVETLSDASGEIRAVLARKV